MTDPIRQEIARHPAAATLAEHDGRWTLTMTRDLPHPPERVWPKLTDPAELARWSPFVPDRVLDAPGPATAREDPDAEPGDAEALVVDPPRELVTRWGGDLLRWTLTPTGEGCRLVLEHTFAARDEWAMYAAGWHICLATVSAVLAGHDVPRVTGPAAREYGWAALRDRYQALS